MKTYIFLFVCKQIAIEIIPKSIVYYIDHILNIISDEKWLQFKNYNERNKN